MKGESVLAAVNANALLTGGTVSEDERQGLGRVLQALMGLNIFEAILANLSFARWPDNARAGLALLATLAGDYRADASQDLDEDWFALYLAWNACFIWPSHYLPDMLCFTMLATPSLGFET